MDRKATASQELLCGECFQTLLQIYHDLLLANNDDLMISVMKDIYPKELILVPDDSDGVSTPFLDLQLVVKNGVVSTHTLRQQQISMC